MSDLKSEPLPDTDENFILSLEAKVQVGVNQFVIDNADMARLLNILKRVQHKNYILSTGIKEIISKS